MAKRKSKKKAKLTVAQAHRKHIQEHVKLLSEEKVSTKEDIKNVVIAFVGVGLVVATVLLVGSLF